VPRWAFDEVIGDIRLDHQVIFFHDQHLTPEQQHLAFGRWLIPSI
jgi:hypothetical protein